MGPAAGPAAPPPPRRRPAPLPPPPKRVTCLLGLVVLGSSCSHGTEPAASVAGAYGLHSVNGSALPIFGLQADTLYLNNDGSVRRFFLQNGTGTVYPAAGTYSVSGSDIAFTS